MAHSPEFLKLLEKMKAIHQKKNDDYAGVGDVNPFFNFDFSAEIISKFTREDDKVFVTLITTKLARIAVLRNRTDKPNNESIEDSLLDLTIYCGLWYAYIAARKTKDAIDKLTAMLQEDENESKFFKDLESESLQSHSKRTKNPKRKK